MLKAFNVILVTVQCTHPENPKTVLAYFVPASQLQRQNRPVEESQLIVTPAGYPCFDDILISVLIWERDRKKLFYGPHWLIFLRLGFYILLRSQSYTSI